MAVLTVLPVPDGIYRIRSSARSGPDLYLEAQANNDVKPVVLDQNEKRQQWTVKVQGDGTYTLVNVGTGSSASILEYKDTGSNDQKYRLVVGGQQTWTLDPRTNGTEFVIGQPEGALAVDCADNNWIILWERWNARNQRWIFESVGPLPGSAVPPPFNGDDDGARVANGRYDIVNAATRNYLLSGYLYITYFRGLYSGGTRVVNAQSNWAWNIKNATGGGFEITLPTPQTWLYERAPVAGTTSPSIICDSTARTVRLVPVPGTNFFHVLLGTARNAKALTDVTGGEGDADQTIYRCVSTDYHPDEHRQYWQLVAC